MPYPGAPMSPAGYDLNPGDLSAESLFGPPSPERQAAIIAEVKRLASSPEKADRDRAEALVRGLGRSMLMVGLNQATRLHDYQNTGLGTLSLSSQDPHGNPRGLSDILLSHWGGDRGEYSPEGLAFSGEVTKAGRPEAYERAENIGKGANIALHALPALWLLRLLSRVPANTPRPIPQAPLSPGPNPLGPGGIPPGLPPGVSLPPPGPIQMPPSPSPAPPPGPPQAPPPPPAAPPAPAVEPAPAAPAPPGPAVLGPARPGAPADLIEQPPKFLQKPSEPPPIDTPLEPMEGPYNRFLDEGGPVPEITPYPPAVRRRIMGPEPEYEPPLPKKLRTPPPPKKGGGGGAPPASGAPAPPANQSLPDRHPKGATDEMGNKIGGRFIGDY